MKTLIVRGAGVTGMCSDEKLAWELMVEMVAKGGVVTYQEAN